MTPCTQDAAPCTQAATLCVSQVLTSYAAHEGTRCVGVHWGRWPEAARLAAMAGCLGGGALAAICRAYAEDFQGWCGCMHAPPVNDSWYTTYYAYFELTT